MDQTQILSLKTLKKVNIPLHLLCQTARLTRVSRKTLATTLSTVCNWEHPTILDSTWTVKSMTTLPKQRMNKKLLPKKAILNKDFRQAVNFAFDRKSYAAQVSGSDASEKTLRSTLVPPTYVQINGEDFGKVVEKQLVTYGDQWKGVSLADGQTSLYNPEKAKASFAKAKAELQKQGVQFPIHLDYIVSQVDNSMVQQASSFKQSVESALGADNVVVDLQKVSDDDFQNITYFSDTAAARDYDISGGWLGS